METATFKFSADTSSVTQRLTEMRKAVGKVTSRFTTSAAASAAAMAKLRAEVTQTSGQIKGMKWGDLFLGVDAFTNLAARAGSMFSGLMRPAMDMEQYLTSFETLLKSSADAQSYVAELRKYAAETPFEMAGIAEAATNLLAFGTTTEKSLKLLRQLGDVAALTKTPLNDLALIYGKAGATGIDTMDVNQLAGRGVNLRKLWAERDGITTQEVQKRVERKAYGTADLDYAFSKLTGKGGDFFEGAIKQSKTLSGVISTMSDQLTELKVQLGDSMADSIKQAAQYLTTEMPRIYEELKPMVGTLASGVKTTAKHLPQILESLGRMAQIMSAFVALKGVATGVVAIKGAVKSGTAAVAAMVAQVNRLGKGLTAAGLAAKGLRAAVSGLSKLALGPVGTALAVAELGMHAWDMLKGGSNEDKKHSKGSTESGGGSSEAWSRSSVRDISAEMARLEAKRKYALEEFGLGFELRLQLLQEYDRKMELLRQALGEGMNRELDAALGAADARTQAYLGAVHNEAETLRKWQESTKTLLGKHEADMVSREDKTWAEQLKNGNFEGLLAATRSNAADLGFTPHWRTAQEGLDAMLKEREFAAGMGDEHAYRNADDLVKTLERLAAREKENIQQQEKLSEARRKADAAMERANLTLAGDSMGLRHLDATEAALALSQQYRGQGMSAEEADTRAAELVATQNAAQQAGLQKPELITQSQVAVGGGGRSIRLGDAQLDVAKQGVAIMTEQKRILEDLRQLLQTPVGTSGIPVLP